MESGAELANVCANSYEIKTPGIRVNVSVGLHCESCL